MTAHWTPTRRQVLKAAAAGVAALTTSAIVRPRIEAFAAGPGQLSDIDHVVILIQENRSFDHYFGTYPGVRGFIDPQAMPGVFQQRFAKNSSVSPTGWIRPYHLDTSMQGGGECTPDPGHGWGTQHAAWNRGAMDGWGDAHSGDADWSFMGFYTRQDIPYFHAVADAFTLCDAYHCSVLGPTTANRLYSVSGWLDPEGIGGGPELSTDLWNPTSRGLFSWTTYPERLTANGISWLAYSSPDADSEENPLVDFKQFYPGGPNYQPAYTDAVFGHTYADFLVDAAAGNLPQVSWVLCNIVDQEHPSGPPQEGEFALEQVITALTASAAAWAKTVLFWTYDENGGFFDHVPPPTAAQGTKDEWVTALPLPNPAGPIGLGFRVPCLIVSPFSKGGFVARDVFDHSSLLKFLELRFGVEIPYLSDWRRHATGDLTSALNFAVPDTSLPRLPVTTSWDPAEHPECIGEEATMSASPQPASFPALWQEPGTRPSPSGPVPAAEVPESPPPLAEVAAGVVVLGAALLGARRARSEPSAGEQAAR